METRILTIQRVMSAAAAFFIVVACAASQGPSSGGIPTDDRWRIVFQLSGGIAGLDRQLEVTSTGELVAQDRRRGTRVAAQTTANELAQIASLVAAAKSVDPGRQTACRDCLLYDIEIDARGRSFVFHLDDLSLPNSGVEPLVKALMNLLDRALAGGLTLQGVH
jgi:hypothetical protein